MPLSLSLSCCGLGFYGVGKPDRGRPVVADVVVAGAFDAVVVVPGPFDGTRAGPVPAWRVEVAGPGDVVPDLG